MIVLATNEQTEKREKLGNKNGKKNYWMDISRDKLRIFPRKSRYDYKRKTLKEELILFEQWHQTTL